MWRRLLVFLCVFSLCVSVAVAAPGELDVDEGDFLPVVVADDVSLYAAVAPVGPDDADGLVSVVLSVIGTYNPVVVEHRYQNTNGTYSYVREIQPDYPWIYSAAIFALVLYCVFRLWGGVLCKR